MLDILTRSIKKIKKIIENVFRKCCVENAAF